MNPDELTCVPRPRVWGIGLTRTGTTSLNAALRLLGYDSIHWPTIGALLYGDLEAATDESVAAVYRYLDLRHPGSKFILTERAQRDWIASTSRQRRRHHGRVHEFLTKGLQNLHPTQKDRWVEIQFTQATLYGTIEFDEDKFLAGFRRYYAGVLDYFCERESNLLRMRICEGDGWRKLCEFLGAPVPSEPFPRENALAPTRDRSRRAARGRKGRSDSSCSQL
jgi:Sulfotransferase domain